MADEQVVSWRVIGAHSPVFASDGHEVGKVLEVAALPEEDIFHGVVFRHHILGRNHMVPADDIERITEMGVYLKIDSQAAEQYAPFQQLTVERLGLKGIFRWKHLGWTKTEE